jgi:hypothetical protein
MTTVVAILALWAASLQAVEPSNDEKNRILIRLSESPAAHYGKVAHDKQSKNQRVFSAIWGLEAEFLAAWEQLDRRFFTYPDNLTDLLYAWVKSHPNDFGSIP